MLSLRTLPCNARDHDGHKEARDRNEIGFLGNYTEQTKLGHAKELSRVKMEVGEIKTEQSEELDMRAFLMEWVKRTI